MNITQLIQEKLRTKNIHDAAIEAGVSASTLSRLQNGKFCPSIKLIKPLAKWLGVTVGDIVDFYG